jgi:hypothetical protein
VKQLAAKIEVESSASEANVMVSLRQLKRLWSARFSFSTIESVSILMVRQMNSVATAL